ncbi:MAG TPA: hypothetical protein VNN25_23130 [Thermoanaerobaculia bacterium]|nr:hypothetical protein [Thermoanaerobaculia bacterium]
MAKAKTHTKTSAAAVQAARTAPKLAQWHFATTAPVFDPARNMLSPPMEITSSRIRTLRMIDESVIVHGRPVNVLTKGEDAEDVAVAEKTAKGGRPQAGKERRR